MWAPASLGWFDFCFFLSYVLIAVSFLLQEDVPAKDDGSGESDDSESDEEDSDDESDESSEDEDDDEDKDEEEDEKDDEPLSLEWPDTRRKQATYLFLLPIVFLLWLTVPDVRNPVRDTIIFLISAVVI